MGFVNRDEGRLALRQHLREAGNAEALRGDEEEVELAVEIVDANLPGGGTIASRVDAVGAEAALAHLRDLVLHQRDERADDQGGSAAGDAWQLVAERFAGAGGHDQEHVAAAGGRAAGLLLIGAE